MIKPGNQLKLIRKLRVNPALAAQLKEFLDVTGQWEEAGKILDLSNTGTENLVLDDKDNMKYIDSFDVFLGESCHPRLKEESIRNRAMLGESYQQSLQRGH